MCESLLVRRRFGVRPDRGVEAYLCEASLCRALARAAEGSVSPRVRRRTLAVHEPLP